MNIDDELAYKLAISQIRGIGIKRFTALLAIEQKLGSFFDGAIPTADFWLVCRSWGLKEPIELDWRQVEKALLWQRSDQHHIVTWQDLAYPTSLKQIDGAPPILYVDGGLENLNTESFAIVGSRHPTTDGRVNAYRFASELVQYGLSITSGLAMGIDGASHEGALAGKGKTIAVLGQGIDFIYPARHRALANQIRQNGALVSEFPLNTAPKPKHFPRRNRIISGLSRGVLVVESSLKSGSLITARYALEQNREVFAIPGSIHNPLAKGCNALIREGAKCVETVEHILEELSIRRPPILSLSPLLPLFEGKFSSIDSLIEKSGLTAEQVSSMLIELELKGEVASVPGGYVRRVDGTL